MVCKSGEISSQSTEIQFAVFGQHGINKKNGTLVHLDPNEQKGFISKFGTSLLWHAGQIDRSEAAIDAYNERIKNAKHIHISVEIENKNTLIKKDEDSQIIDNSSVKKDQKLIEKLDEAEDKLHHAEKDLKNALLKLEQEKGELLNENHLIKVKLNETVSIYKGALAEQKQKFKENITAQENNHKNSVIVITNQHAQEDLKTKHLYEAKLQELLDQNEKLRESSSLQIQEISLQNEKKFAHLEQAHAEHCNHLARELEMAKEDVQKIKQALQEATEHAHDHSEIENKLSIVAKAHQAAVELLEQRNQEYKDLHARHEQLTHTHAKIVLEIDLKAKNLEKANETNAQLHVEHQSVLEKLKKAEHCIEQKENEFEQRLKTEIQKVESTFKDVEGRLRTDLTNVHNKLLSAEKKATEASNSFRQLLKGNSPHSVTVIENFLKKHKLHKTDHGKQLLEDVHAKTIEIDVKVENKEGGHKAKKHKHIEIEIKENAPVAE
jgi:hypothetical protein